MSKLDTRFPTRVSIANLNSNPIKTTQTNLSSNSRAQTVVINSISLTSKRMPYNVYSSIDFVTFANQSGNAAQGSVLFDIEQPVRASDRYITSGGYGPNFATQGINIKTFDNGDDLIYPNGRGYSDFWSASAWEEVVVDRGTTWVNVGNGNDVVVGGYGYDLIGSRAAGITTNLLFDPFGADDSTATGSKFYIGGSGRDVLDGGNDADYLIGDRFNEYELYLPKAILSKNIPQAFSVHKQYIESYQPDSWTEPNSKARYGKAAKGTDRLAVTKLVGLSGSDYPLWTPGNDVIHGYGGDDLLYGDDNAEDNLALVDNFKKFAGNDSRINWSTLRLGDDFLDGGSGDDQIFGGFGSDAIIGGKGSDFISTGDQIIAPGYDPLWGPKVVWGDEYNPTNDKGRAYSPDVYMIGDIFSTSGEIENSKSGIIDTSQLRQTMAERMKSYADAWKTYGKIIKSIPRVGSIIEGLGNAFFQYAKSFDKQVPNSGKTAKPLEALTVIKDFDPTDQLVMRLAPGETFDQDLKSKIFTINTFGYNKINPLVNDSLGGEGRMIYYSKGASEQYDRVFLEGYTGELFKLKEETDPTSGVKLVYLGGSDYSGISLA